MQLIILYQRPLLSKGLWKGKPLERRGRQIALQTASGRQLLVDGVVAGIGIEPNSGQARAAGLEVDNGIVVDALLRTSHLDIYAAGDVANFANPALGKRMRVEHEERIPWAGTPDETWPACLRIV
jgi:NADPH-dependent 2,4-dienoyl-CoA reductase/sulfur reductase-like enzyme